MNYIVNPSRKALAIAFAGSLLSGVSSAATIAYNFETPGNEQDVNTTTADYTDADTNTFGDGVTGVTVGNFTITDARTQANFSTRASSEWANVSASGVGNSMTLTPSMSFTVSIDDTVEVDLTNLAFDYGYFSSAGSNTTIDWNLTLSTGSSSSSSGGDYTHNGVANFQQFGSGNALILSGLTGLTDTTVTFTWLFDSSKSNNIGVQSHFLDNIALTGTVTPVPEPSTTAILGLGGLALLFRRRK